MPTTTSLLQLDQVTARAGMMAFGPFSFTISHGEHIAILGPSGAGKSTLLRIISRELVPTAGTIALDGQPMSSLPLPELSKRRAVLPQSHEVAFGLETDLVIRLGRVARMHDPHLHDIIAQAAALACCSHLLGRRFDTLSGGEKARVQLARVFAQLWDINDGLFLVDEPIAALDPGLQFDLMASISTFARDRNHAVIAVLHDINHALSNFTRILLVKNGQLTGDHPSSVDIVPHLEQLYDIALDTMTTTDGDIFVRPVRNRRPSGKVAA